MIISKERHSELYKAIADPIMDLRIKLSASIADDMDIKLDKLEIDIYIRIIKVMNLQKSAKLNHKVTTTQ